MHARIFVILFCTGALLIVVLVNEHWSGSNGQRSGSTESTGENTYYSVGERDQLWKEIEDYFISGSRENTQLAEIDTHLSQEKVDSGGKEPLDAGEVSAYAQNSYPDQPNLLARHAESIALQNNGSFAGEPFELLSRSLDIDSRHKPSLWMMALANQQMGNHKAAVLLLEMLKRELPLSGDSTETVNAATAVSMSQIELQSEAEGESVSDIEHNETVSTRSKNPVINLYITLDPVILKSFSPDDTVYIFAQASDGSAMPLAVTRRRVSDFPTEVSLDDSMSMMPSLTLSSSDLVTVGARASRSGTAMPMTGDWEVKLYEVPVGAAEVIPLKIEYELK